MLYSSTSTLGEHCRAILRGNCCENPYSFTTYALYTLRPVTRRCLYIRKPTSFIVIKVLSMRMRVRNDKRTQSHDIYSVPKVPVKSLPPSFFLFCSTSGLELSTNTTGSSTYQNAGKSTNDSCVPGKIKLRFYNTEPPRSGVWTCHTR